MNTYKIIGVVAILLSAPIAFANENDVTASITRERPALMKNQGATTTRATRDALKEKAQATREEAKEKMETQREEAKKRMEVAREEAKTRMETRREELKQRLSDIRDTQKQQRAERIAKQFDKLNQKWTDHFIKLLDRYDAITEKIQDRADIAEGAGKDIAATTAAIQSAKATINTARTAIIAQTAKTYTIDTSAITTTTATTTTNGQDELMKSLRTAFQNVHKTIFKDLFALRDGVMKDARKSVQDALQTLKMIPRVDENDDENTASTTGESN